MRVRYSRQSVGDLAGSIEQLARVRAVEAMDGPARGSRLYIVENGGGLAFTVNADRGFDITECTFSGIPVAWRSPVGDVHPSYAGDGEARLLRAFTGGLFFTAGYTQFGAACTDDGHFLPQHGWATFLPAMAVRSENGWEGDNYRLRLSGEVRQSRLFGECITLRRTYETELGSDCFWIEDVLKNEGAHPTPHMMLYHFNFGFPLIAPGTEIVMNVASTSTRDAVAATGLSQALRMSEPEANFPEQVFLHELTPGEDGFGSVAIENHGIGMALRLDFDMSTLPYLYQWKVSEKGTYVLGIEPANCKGIGGRTEARSNGSLEILQAGEEVRYRLKATFGI